MPAENNLLPALVSPGDNLMLPLALSSPPNPAALFKALRRRWKIAGFMGCLSAVIVTVGCWYFLPPAKHTARTLMRVPPGSPFLFPTKEPVLDIQDHQRNQVAMVKSRLVLNSALKDRRATDLSLLKEKVEPIEWLEREMQADFSVAPEIMRIQLAGDDPAELTLLIKLIQEAYHREILDKERVDRNERLTMLRQLHEKYESQLRTRKEEQRKFEQMAGGKDTQMRGLVLGFMQQQLNWAERELISTQSELRRTRADLAARKVNDKGLDISAIPDGVVDEHMNQEPAVQEARANIRHLQTVLEGTVKVAKEGENSPKAAEIRRKIAESEQSLVLLRKQLTPVVTEDVRQRGRHEASRTLSQLQIRLAVGEEDEKVLTTDVANLRNAIRERTENGGKAEAEREDMVHLEETTKRIASEESALEFELQAPIRYRVLEEGVVTKPTENKRVVLIAGGAGLGTLAAVLLAFALFEFRARRLDAPDEVVFGLGLPLVGSIPDTNIRAVSEKQTNGDQSCLNEAVDTVRTMLLKAAEHETLRVVLITSAQSGEGKTSLSTQLAASLAQVGYTTLLIDGDLRNPIAHKVFQLERGPGLCDLLRFEAGLEDVIRPTKVNRLSMITAGKWDGGATRALAQNGARELINGLRSRFDFVIIDSSPVLPVVDPLLLGQYADGAIISVLREVSRMPNIFAAYQRLSAGGVRVIGAVMSGVRVDRYGSNYAYGYYGAKVEADQPAA